MNAELTEEQALLQDSVAQFCAAEMPLTKVRESADDPVGLSDALWQQVAEQGWLGILVPEENGGFGLGVTELALICEEMGRGLLPGPYLSTVLAAHALTLGGSDAAKNAWIEKVIGGKAKGTLALLEQDGQLNPGAVRLAAVADSGGYTLTGTKSLVPDAMAANFFVVAARTGENANDVTLFVVDAKAGGVSVAANTLTDSTSRSGQVTLDGVVVGEDAVVGAVGASWEIVEQILLVANVCIAADSLAGAEHILTMTIQYAKERTQFGKLIGSFQAVKHPLAKLFTQLESARSGYQYAAWAVDAQSVDVNSAVAVARLTATEAYRRTTLDCLQAHGGIGFTWEYDLHLYLKRAKHNEYQYGDARDYEDIVAREALGI